MGRITTWSLGERAGGLVAVLVAVVLAAFSGGAAAQSIEEGYIPVGDDVALYYQKHGDGPPDLIVTNQISAAVPLSGLVGAWTVVFYDTRGRGLSTPIRDPALLGMDHEIADIAAVHEHFGGEPATILGWSLWGGFAQLYAARHPGRVRGVVAFGPIEPAADPYAQMETLKPGPDFDALDAYFASVPDDMPGYEACLGAYDIIHVSQVADSSAHLIPDMNRKVCALPSERDDNVLFTVLPIFESMGDWNWLDELATVQAPVLIGHGDEDTVVPEGIEANVATVPDARVVVVEDAGHMGFVEHPGRYVEIVDAFLATLP